MGYRYKVLIADVEYGMSDIASCKIEHPLFDKLSVGNTCAAELDITIWPKSDIPKMARIVPYVIAEDGTETQLGVFYTDTRAKMGKMLNIIAYDEMLKADLEWIPDQSLKFPMTMSDAVTEITDLMGVELDSRTELNSAYTIDYLANEWTLRDVLGFIGAAHAGNWIFTNEGKLLLVPLFDGMPAETNHLVSECGDAILFGGVRITV